jgi:beta-1,4-mannosyltransferase
VPDGFFPPFQEPDSTPFTIVKESKSFPDSNDASYVPPKPHRIPLNETHYAELELAALRPERPAILVSSTSWTPDEDFNILLEALQEYDVQAQRLTSLPNLFAIVTGKGPQKQHYMNRIAELQPKWKRVRCISLWLDAEDYPILLGLYSISPHHA